MGCADELTCGVAVPELVAVSAVVGVICAVDGVDGAVGTVDAVDITVCSAGKATDTVDDDTEPGVMGFSAAEGCAL